MKLSTKSRYALRSMINIAMSNKDTPTSIAEVSNSEEISERYLELIFAKLKKEKLMDSSRGSKGGYSLARDPSTITVQDVVSIMENSSTIVGNQDQSDSMKRMLSKQIWSPIDDNLHYLLSNITLSDLIK